jgi:hypothetical protein
MKPQWFFTSAELREYMKVTVKKWDLTEVGTKLEASACVIFMGDVSL